MDEETKLYQVVANLHESVEILCREQKATKELINRRVKEVDDMYSTVCDAFPGGDMERHRLYHEEVIAQVKSRKEFWQKLSFELAKWGLIGFLGWLVIQIWHGALTGPKG